MRPDNTLEEWDELGMMMYQEEVGPTGELYRTAKQKRERNADVDHAMAYIDELLLANQCWHYQDPIDPYIVTFPYSIYLSKGQEFLCIDTNTEFVVEWVEVVTQRFNGVLRQGKTGRCRLSGPHEPSEKYRLRVKSPETDALAFYKGQPSNISGTYKFDDSSLDSGRATGNYTDTITCMVTERSPGSMGKEPFGDPKEIKPRFRENIFDTDETSKSVSILGQWFDNIVQFSVWAQTNHRADTLLAWFEEFMMRYAWVLKWNGVQQVYYWQRTRDAKVTRWRDDIVHRTVEYYFRTEKLGLLHERRLSGLELTVEMAVDGESPTELYSTTEDPTEWPTPYSGVVPLATVDGTGTLIIQR